MTGLHYIAQDLQLYHVIAPSGWMADFFDWQELERWAAVYPPDGTLGAPVEVPAVVAAADPLTGAPSVPRVVPDGNGNRSAGTLDNP